MQARIHTAHTHKNARAHTHKNARAHTHKNARAHTHKNARAHTHKNARAHTHKNARMHTYKHARTYLLTYVHMAWCLPGVRTRLLQRVASADARAKLARSFSTLRKTHCIICV